MFACPQPAAAGTGVSLRCLWRCLSSPMSVFANACLREEGSRHFIGRPPAFFHPARFRVAGGTNRRPGAGDPRQVLASGKSSSEQVLLRASPRPGKFFPRASPPRASPPRSWTPVCGTWLVNDGLTGWRSMAGSMAADCLLLGPDGARPSVRSIRPCPSVRARPSGGLVFRFSGQVRPPSLHI